MQKKKVLDFVVLIEQDKEGWYVATVPSLQGCHTQGRTIPQLLERVKEAIQVCIEAEELDLPLMKFIGLQTVEVKA